MTGTWLVLFLIHNLEDIELQIIGRVVRPQNRVIRSLLAELHLPEALVRIMGCLRDGLLEEVCRHEMGAGAGRKKTTVPDG